MFREQPGVLSESVKREVTWYTIKFDSKPYRRRHTVGGITRYPRKHSVDAQGTALWNRVAVPNPAQVAPHLTRFLKTKFPPQLRRSYQLDKVKGRGGGGSTHPRALRSWRASRGRRQWSAWSSPSSASAARAACCSCHRGPSSNSADCWSKVSPGPIRSHRRPGGPGAPRSQACPGLPSHRRPPRLEVY